MDNIRQYDPKGSSYAQRIPDHEWEEMRPILERYHRLAIPRTRMLKRLAKKYDFHPSRAQLNSRMSAWGYTVREGLNDRQEGDLPDESPVVLTGVGGFDKFGLERKVVGGWDVNGQLRHFRDSPEPAHFLDILSLDPSDPHPQDLRLGTFDFSYLGPADHACSNWLPSPHNDAKRLKCSFRERELFQTNVYQLECATGTDPDHGDSDDVLYDLQSTSSFRSFRRAGKNTRDVHGPSSVCGASTFSAGSMKTMNSAKLVERLFPTY